MNLNKMNKELSANTTLSHYRIVSKIGAGGMGEVYLAEDTTLNRKVALKLLPVELTDHKDRLKRFEQEAQAVSALNHPNILTIYEFGTEDNSHFIVMEFVEGLTLREKMAIGGMSTMRPRNGFGMARALQSTGASSFSFKGKNTDIREIGQKLNVGAVLEGSVRKSGNRLRITAQLINVADGYHLWSERYDREMQDIFDIQDEISLAIVGALKVKLLGAEKTAVLKRYTENTEAYQLYLKGRFHCSKWTAEGMKNAIEYFEQAIVIEPDYAPAFAGLAASYVYLWLFNYLPPDESLPQMKAAAIRAMEIDRGLAESHYAIARMKFWYEWEFQEAELEFKKGIELNPNYSEAHEQYVLRCYLAMVHAGMGEMDRAFESFEQAYQQRDGILVLLKHIARFIPGLSADPRLADLLRRIGLPE